MDLLIAIVFDGLTFASYLFLVAVGLSLIFGVMKILNVTHGAFYAFGAYTAAWSIGWFLSQLSNPWDPGALGYVTYLLMPLSAIVVGLILGAVIEVVLLRRLYGFDEVIIVLATFATFLILEDVILLIWGTNPYFADVPYYLLGSVEVTDKMILPVYDFLLIGLAGLVAVGVWWGLNRTRNGKMLLAVIHDREMSASMGVNVNRVFLITFIAGAMLGALGGAVNAVKSSVVPGIGVEVIVLAFAVVVIGGMGSVAGAIIGALTVGLVRSWAVQQFPEFEMFVVYAVMALVLIVRPEGLFSPPKARKI